MINVLELNIQSNFDWMNLCDNDIMLGIQSVFLRGVEYDQRSLTLQDRTADRINSNRVATYVPRGQQRLKWMLSENHAFGFVAFTVVISM